MDEKIIDFAKLIGEPTRLRLLNHLKKECCVGELWKRLDLPQNLVSHHLRALREAGLIIAERRGQKVVYRLDKSLIKKRLKSLTKHIV